MEKNAKNHYREYYAFSKMHLSGNNMKSIQQILNLKYNDTISRLNGTHTYIYV